DTNAAWSRRFSPRFSLRVRYGLTRTTADTTPFFAHRANVSGDAGITGNNQDAENWGPPTLVFPAIAGLSDVQYERTTRLMYGGGVEAPMRRGLHTLTAGADLRRHGVDIQSQPDPRGTLTFTGSASGVAFADFLLGIPAASSLAFSETFTRLHGRSYDA